ncbi:hypothetical protein BgiBS90_003303 [Biomphalaria glabrata]|nr:hypothetical protein BgiBS90_003303 [Biomphalaria glabrata]
MYVHIKTELVRLWYHIHHVRCSGTPILFDFVMPLGKTFRMAVNSLTIALAVLNHAQCQRRHTTSEATHVRGDTTSEVTHKVKGDTQRQRRHTTSEATHNVRDDTHAMTHSHEMKTGSPLISPTIFLGSISLTERSGNHSRVHALTQLARHPIRKVHSRTNLPKVASLHPNYVIKPSRSG